MKKAKQAWVLKTKSYLQRLGNGEYLLVKTPESLQVLEDLKHLVLSNDTYILWISRDLDACVTFGVIRGNHHLPTHQFRMNTGVLTLDFNAHSPDVASMALESLLLIPC